MTALLIVLALWTVGAIALGALLALIGQRLNPRWTGDVDDQDN